VAVHAMHSGNFVPHTLRLEDVGNSRLVHPGQVADDLRASIRTGAYPPGSQLPSYEELMKHYLVSITVIRSAIRELRTERLVRTHQGKGVFVTDPLPPLADGGPAAASQAATERAETRALAAEVASLRAELRKLAQRDDVARIEANLIELYGRTGHDYPLEDQHTEAQQEISERTARRGRGS
jgi:GntR family transcriptional regulator